MMQPKKTFNVVMVLESAFPSVGGGGAENQVATLCQNLPVDVEAEIVVPRVDYAPQAIRDEFKGTPIRRIAYPAIPLVGGIILLMKLAWMLLVDARKIDMIHCHIAGNMAAISALIGRITGKQVLVKLTGWHELELGILSPINSVRNRFNRWAIKKATYIQTTSQLMEHSLREFGFSNDQIRYLPNAVDTDRFQPKPESKQAIRSQLGIEQKRTGIFMGRLVEEKNLHRLIKCWTSVVKPTGKCQLLLVGEGHLRDEHQSLINELGCQDDIILVGATKQVDLYFQASDFAILPSTFEGLSNALLEAMASGLPMLGSRVSGTADMVDHELNGWLFEPTDEQALDDCLSTIINKSDQELQNLGQQARKKIMAFAGKDAVISKLLDLYQYPGQLEKEY